MNAKQSLSSISANQDLWVEQFRQEMFERDYRSGLSAAKSEGIAIGEARGEKRGKELGRTEAKFEAARNMLTQGMDADKIAQWLALPLETVQQLANELQTKA